MIFSLCGIVGYHGKKIANGINGRFETNDLRVIQILKNKGFKELRNELIEPKTVQIEKPKSKGKRK